MSKLKDRAMAKVYANAMTANQSLKDAEKLVGNPGNLNMDQVQKLIDHKERELEIFLFIIDAVEAYESEQD